MNRFIEWHACPTALLAVSLCSGCAQTVRPDDAGDSAVVVPDGATIGADGAAVGDPPGRTRVESTRRISCPGGPDIGGQVQWVIDTDLPLAQRASFETAVRYDVSRAPQRTTWITGAGRVPRPVGATAAQECGDSVARLDVTMTFRDPSGAERQLARSMEVRYEPGVIIQQQVALSSACALPATDCVTDGGAACSVDESCRRQGLVCAEGGRCVAM